MKNITTKIYTRTPGIYCIKNKITTRVYIGSTVNLYTRLIQHRAALLKGIHGNKYLQNSFNKHNIENFEINILEFCKKKELWKRESYHCTQFNKVYNLKTIEKTRFGFKRILSKETRKKISNSKKGKIPKNFKTMQQKRWRKIAKYKNGKLEEVYNNTPLAAQSMKMDYKLLHYFIGKKLKQKSKYFNKDTWFEYYE